jgi:carboxymethylenebutenolidase
MKSFTIVLVLLVTISLHAQTHSCCHVDPAVSMAMLAADPDFAALHAEPLPFPNPSQLQGVTVSYPTLDGQNGSGYLVKGAADTTKILFVFHEWWGLNEYIKDEAARLANDLGVTTFALDLYDGKVAATREQAQQYVQALTPERAMAIINGAFAHFGSMKKYATIGWCMGGMWSLKAAIAGTNYPVIGCVMYYGMPETNPAALAPLHAPVLGIFAKRDQSITPEIVKQAKAAFKKAGKKITVHSYDAVHAFANPSNPDHNAKSAADAYKKTIIFLKKQYKAKK